MNLKKTNRYVPFHTGKYEVSPGLNPLGTDFGNGDTEKNIFQIDESVSRYLVNKEQCRRENIQKYYCRAQEYATTAKAINQFIIQQVVAAYPDLFQLDKNNEDWELQCNLTGETITFSSDYELIETTAVNTYLSLFDALAGQVPEDLAIWQLEEENDGLAALHVCAPNHWSPEKKAGKNFSAVHAPVAGMEKLRGNYKPMLQAIINKGSFVRFVWGLATDCRLNHHPEAPAVEQTEKWQGRGFNANQPELYVRVERQTLTGFSAQKAVFFTIRTYFLRVDQLAGHELKQLKAALLTMSPEARAYKGLANNYGLILAWIDQLMGRNSTSGNL